MWTSHHISECSVATYQLVAPILDHFRRPTLILFQAQLLVPGNFKDQNVSSWVYTMLPSRLVSSKQWPLVHCLCLQIRFGFWNTVSQFYLYVVCDYFLIVMAELSSCGRDNMTCKPQMCALKKLAFLGESFSTSVLDHVPSLPGGLEFLTPAILCLLPGSWGRLTKDNEVGLFFEKANSVEVHELLCRPTAWVCVCLCMSVAPLGAVSSMPHCGWDSMRSFKF